MRIALVCCLVLLGSSCTVPADTSRPAESAMGRLSPHQPALTPLVIDSALPPAEEMRRFRAGLGAARDSLHGGAPSREALVRSYLRALETHDTLAIRALVMDRVEFADLYYPFSRYAHPPYRSPVGLVWSLLQQNSEKGAVRALRRLGGQKLQFERLTCRGFAEPLGRSRLLGGCTTRFVVAGTDTTERRLFSAILQTAGRYKFVSYASDM